MAGCLASKDIGITWDEPFYIYRGMDSGRTFQETAHQAARLHLLEAFRTFRDSPAWKYYPQIGFFQRYVHGFFFCLFSRALDPPLVFRAGSLFLWAVMLFFLALLAWEFFGREAAWLALFLALGFPRMEAHGFLATTESSLLAMWVICIWVYLKCLKGQWPEWAWGGIWGIGLTAKFQLVCLIAPLTLWGFFRVRKKTIHLLLWGLGLGPAVFFLVQPCYWLLFWENVRHYFQAWVFHPPMALFFQGRVFQGHGPWYYAWVIILVTIPLPFLLLTLLGTYKALQSYRSGAWLFLLLAAMPLVMTMAPNVPNYDGERLFVQAYPAFVLLAVQGGVFLWDRFPRWKIQLLGTCLLFSLLTLVRVHPFYMEYYNALAGGPEGALRRGFETSYWTDGVNHDFLEDLNRRLPPNSKIWLQGMMRDPLDYAKGIGWLRKDIQYTDRFEPDVSYLMIYARQGALKDPRAMQTMTAESQVCYQDVPIVKLVKRRPSPPE